MNFKNYLYFKPRELNESNLCILNEIYFGKTPRIKILEKLCQYFIESLNNPQKTFDLSSFERIKKKSRIKLKIQNNRFSNKLNYNIHDDQTYSSLNTNQKRILSLIEDCISIIFGIDSVKIIISKNYQYYYNMAIDHSLINNLIYERKNGTYIPKIQTNDNKCVDLDYVKDNIIVKNTGISLNPIKCKLSIILYFSLLLKKKTAEVMISDILHEIGHFFSHLILPLNKYLLSNWNYFNLYFHKKNKYLSYKEIDKCIKIIKDHQELFEISDNEIKKIIGSAYENKKEALESIAKRVNEKFADQFVSLYGYGPNLARDFITDNVYNNRLLNSYEKIEKINSKILNKNSNFQQLATRSNIEKLDCHPLNIDRMRSQLLQLQAERDNPRLSSYKKKQIENDIEDIRQLLRSVKPNANVLNYYDNTSDDEILEKILEERFRKKIKNLQAQNQFLNSDIASVSQDISSCTDNIKIIEENIKLLKALDSEFIQTIRKKSSKTMQLMSDEEIAEKYIKIFSLSLKKEKERLDIVINSSNCYKNDIKSNMEKIESINKDMSDFLKNSREVKKAIESERELKYRIYMRSQYRNYNDVIRHKKKNTKNWMYEKDSYVNPYDVSNELDMLYDKTKARSKK